ncbi:hypothetical protein RDWZM_003032 [Blomia tropicalis]|uniref:lysozyme n=1 Tax=Blomia tropicalis TaxID=40697 RepID=A0A9Q0MHF7_BLOTA|nr:hypothetical protein RDWZM_003032 [Blomia tropicalis]
MFILFKLILSSLLLIVQLEDQLVWGSPNSQCLQCMCHASSGCKAAIRCHNSGNGQYFCGPYQISWAYWADAGKPGYTGFSNDFENCLIDKNCAEATVRGYMAKWANDCNNDGKVDCLDYAAIHKAGPTVIEIVRPNPARSVSSHSSATSTSTSTSFGSNPIVHSYFSSASSSSFSRHNVTRSNNVEITETVSSNSNPIIDNRRTTSSRVVNQPELNRPIAVSLPRPTNTNRHIEPLPLSTLPNVNNKPIKRIVPEECLECLCQASSKCDINKGCNGAYCGPFLLSWGYWADGGKSGNGLDYVSCANNKTCAGLSVQGYMNKWNKDCNNDGVIDCTDFALIHKLGPHGCNKLEAIQNTDYWKQYTVCYHIPNDEYDSTNSVGESVRSIPDTNLNTFPVRVVERVEEPLPIPAIRNNRPISRGSNSRPNDSHVRISFNNREVVNLSPNSPASINHRAPLPLPPIKPVDQPINREFNEINSPSLRSTDSLVTKPPITSFDDSNLNKPNYETVHTESPHHYLPLNDEDNRNIPITSAAPTETSFSDTPTEPKFAEVSLTPRRFTDNNGTRTNSLVTQECLECICHASSRCNPSIGCVNGGSGKFICGPFQVDWEYWTEAGKPGNRADLSNLENFQMCLTNRQCADDAVRGYMAKWRKDCNEDGIVDCNDFAALHIAGPNSCNAQWFLDSQYYSDFRSCYDFRRR